MYDVAKKHQINIARKTLRMTPLTADILGGMSYEEAYRIIFKTDLHNRLKELIRKYPAGCYSWELEKYGWTPQSLMDELGLYNFAEESFK